MAKTASYLSALAFGILLCLGPVVSGQDILGVMSEVMKPDVADLLNLTDEQREGVRDLFRSRSGSAIGLSQQLREAPLSQHGEMRAAFAAESEKLLFDMLDPEQKQKLSEYRVEWLGMLALADETVAQQLNLADWQRQIVAEWQTKVRGSRRDADSQKTRAEAERAIRQEISESQWAQWQVLAGQAKANEVGSPTPPERAEPVPAIAAAAQPDAGRASQTATSSSDENREPIDDLRLTLKFQDQPWEEVIRWLASQADMSVQSDVFPPGTFTYFGTEQYTVSEALDLMNAALLNGGYTLLRQGRMLRCIDFESDKELVLELFTELADVVPVEELADRGRYELIKVLFTLERLDPEIVKEEVEQLLSLHGSVVSLPQSGQLWVTDMAGNVRTIASYIRRAEDPQSARGSSIQIIPLKNINAEEVLAVARPLLGLPDGSNTSDDLSVSTNTFGTVIYCKGSADKIQNLRDLVKEMDTPPSETEAVVQVEVPYIDRHRVVGIDLQLAYEVVSQLLAGGPADTKLAPDETAKQLVLFAREDDHKMVQDTLQKLASESSAFEVIQLKHLDTQVAIELIKKFFGITDSADAASGAPVIDGDRMAKQVWVKGSAAQIQQIREQIETLENNYQSNDLLGDRIRMLPATGRQATDAIQQIEALWEQAYGDRSSIKVITPGASAGPGLQQRTYAPQSKDRSARFSTPGAPAPVAKPAEPESVAPEAATSTSTSSDRDSAAFSPTRGHFVVQEEVVQEEVVQGGVVQDPVPSPFGDPQQNEETADSEVEVKNSEIVIMQGPAGLIVTSDDKEALARFENLWRLVTEQTAMASDSPVVVYLRNIPAAAGKELLETILSGSSGSSEGGGGLLGDMAGSMFGGMGGMMGALMGSGGGGGDLVGSSTGIASGDYSIVADPRLNALIIKAGPSDMMLIEQLLEVIDQVESPYLIETRGQFAAIEVTYQDVTQVMNTVKSLYGDRIAGAAPAGGGGNQQPDPAALIAALRGGGRGGRGGGGGTNSALTEPKISLAADTMTNMLLVFAQPNQIEEIRGLVEMMDAAGADFEEEIAVSEIGAINTEVLKTGIARILGSRAVTNSSGSTSTTSPGQQSASPSDDAAAAARRAEFFQRMREGGGFGGGTTGRTGGFGGGTGGFGGGTGGFGGGTGGFGGGTGGFGGGTRGGGTQGSNRGTQGGRGGR